MPRQGDFAGVVRQPARSQDRCDAVSRSSSGHEKRCLVTKAACSSWAVRMRIWCSPAPAFPSREKHLLGGDFQPFSRRQGSEPSRGGSASRCGRSFIGAREMATSASHRAPHSGGRHRDERLSGREGADERHCSYPARRQEPGKYDRRRAVGPAMSGAFDVRKAEKLFRKAGVVVCQLETLSPPFGRRRRSPGRSISLSCSNPAPREPFRPHIETRSYPHPE